MSYDLTWAYGVVVEYWQKHENACEAMRSMYKYDRNVLAKWVGGDQVRWNRYKRLIKYVEERADIVEEMYNSGKLDKKKYQTAVQYFREHIKRRCYDSIPKQLDLDLDSDIIQER